MYKFLTKNGQLLAVLLSVAVIAVFFIFIIVGLNNSGFDMSTDLNMHKKDVKFFDAGLYLTIVLFIVAVLIWILFSVYHLVTNPKGSIKFMLGGLAIVGVFVLFYFMTSSDVTGKLPELMSRLNISDTVHRIISGGISTSIVLAAVAVLVMLGTELVNIFK